MTRCQRNLLVLSYIPIDRVATIYASADATLPCLYLTCSVSYSVMTCSHPVYFSVFTVLPDRPLQWTTSSTRALDATSWRFPWRMTTMTCTSLSRILSLGSDDPWVDFMCSPL